MVANLNNFPVPQVGGEGRWLVVGDDGIPRPEVNPLPVKNMLARTVQMCQARGIRTDSKGRKAWGLHAVSTMVRNDWLRRSDAAAREQMGLMRSDAFDPSAGFYDIEQLTYKFEEVIREETPPLHAFEVFPTDTRVRPGVLEYKQYRLQSTGQVIVYNGGNGVDIQPSSVAQVKQTAGVVYLVSKAAIDLMQAMADQYTGFDTLDEKMAASRLAINTWENDAVWYGSPENNLLGLFNHPFIDTYISGVAYKSSTATDDLIDDLGMWARFNRKVSKGAFQVDTVTISSELHGFLSNRPRSTGTDKSVWQWFVDNNKHIVNVNIVDELDDAGGSGVHAMVFSRTGGGIRSASATIIKPMGLTILPADQRPLGTDMYLMSGFGGLNHRRVGDTLIVYVNTN